MIVTHLEECDLSQAITPRLMSLFLSYGKLKKLALPTGANELSALSLRNGDSMQIATT